MSESEQQDQLEREIKRLRQQREETAVRYKKWRRVRLLRMFFLFAIAYGLSFYLFSFYFTVESALKLLGLLSLAMALGTAAFAYLEPSSSSRLDDTVEKSFAKTRYYLDKQLTEIRESLGHPNHAPPQFTEVDKSKILTSIQAKLESEALSSYVAGIQELVTKNVQRDSVEQLFRSIVDRLGREVQDQAKRGNLNLILGIFTTLVGLAVLGYSVFYAPATQTPIEILAYFVPRVSLVVLIEVFAYFFLRLYKQSLSEIKHFQNEITNIESRQLAIQLAAIHSEPELRLKIVEELVKTERNFLLSKDQTTVDLERDKLSRSTYSELLNSIKELVKRKE